MPPRAFPPDAQPSIGVAIQHVASRAHLLPRLDEGLGGIAAWGHRLAVVEGDPIARDPWRTYQACLAWATGMPGLTHLLVIQDDALPVPRFHERLSAAVAARPGDLLCLYVPEHPGYMGRAIRTAVEKGQPFAMIPGGMFTPLVAAVWPVWMAEECLAWIETDQAARVKRCDDAQVARFMRRRRYQAQAVAPSLVDHDEETPSTLGLGRYPRHAAVLAQ